MRRCHSEAMQDYRRVHNKEMWERPLRGSVSYGEPLSQEVVYRALSQDCPGAGRYEDPPQYRPRTCPVAKAAAEEQEVGD